MNQFALPDKLRGVEKGCKGVEKGLQQRLHLIGKKGYPQSQCPAELGNEKALRDERVLSSACFGRSERVSKLLRFLVERQLAGRETHFLYDALLRLTTPRLGGPRSRRLIDYGSVGECLPQLRRHVQPIWQIVMHVVNHGTLHRGQIVGMLRQPGFASGR